MRRLLCALSLAFTLAACSTAVPAPTPPQPTLAPTDVPATATALPSPTQQPTPTPPEPTATLEPTSAPTPEPTTEPATPTPDASTEPVLFAPGVISTEDAHEWHVTFTPDGATAYFARSDRFFPQSRQATIMVSTLEDGAWTMPEVASFSGEFSDIDPSISPDGLRLFFSSIRPVEGAERRDLDVWMVERTDSGWGDPIHLGAEVNSDSDELYPSVASDGTLYFASDRQGGAGGWDIYRSTPSEVATYGPAENLGVPINTSAWEYNPTISADGTLLLFASLNRPGGAGAGDIFVSEGVDGRWRPARSLGNPVNTGADEYHPSLSPDDQRLYFVRNTGNGDLYYFDGWR